jgi:hypothetical protein
VGNDPARPHPPLLPFGLRQVWRQDTTAAAAPRAKLSTQAVMWALKSAVIDRMSIAVGLGRAELAAGANQLDLWDTSVP